MQHQILCASSQFHNSCIMSSSFNLQLGHHGYVRTLLFTRLAHAGRMLWHALHANILTLLGSFAFQIEYQTISNAILLELPIPIVHIPSCTFYLFFHTKLEIQYLLEISAIQPLLNVMNIGTLKSNLIRTIGLYP